MRLPHPSTVIATLALAASVGGGSAYAATKLAANSVSSTTVRDRTLRLKDLHPTARPAPLTGRAFTRAVGDALLSPDTQAVVDSLRGAVQGAAGRDGAQGPAGTPGAPGVDGAVGARGPAGLGAGGVTVREATGPAPAEGTGGALARCQAGETPLSGGGRLEGGQDGAGILQASTPDAEGWLVVMGNVGTSPATVRAYVVCAQQAGQ